MDRFKLVSCTGKTENEFDVITDSVFDEAFESVCKFYQPKYNKCVFSVCTKTRPYSDSLQWKGLKKFFGNYADLIVLLTAGIIPLEFENYYPYDSYDLKTPNIGLSTYARYLLEERLDTFLSRFHWDKSVFLIPPNTGIQEAVRMCNIENSLVLPNIKQWKHAHDSDQFIGYNLERCRILSKNCIKKACEYLEIDNTVDDFSRNCSLLQAVENVYASMIPQKPYTNKDIINMICRYGDYERTYIFKAIQSNCTDCIDYKYGLKNNKYFRKVGKFYYKNIENLKIQVTQKLF